MFSESGGRGGSVARRADATAHDPGQAAFLDRRSALLERDRRGVSRDQGPGAPSRSGLLAHSFAAKVGPLPAGGAGPAAGGGRVVDDLP